MDAQRKVPVLPEYLPEYGNMYQWVVDTTKAVRKQQHPPAPPALEQKMKRL